MKQTIEERFGLCKHCLCDTDRYCHTYCHIYSKYCGAVEQKRIDIDKACEWLKSANGHRFNGFEIVYTQGFINDFRKAMEK